MSVLNRLARLFGVRKTAVQGESHALHQGPQLHQLQRKLGYQFENLEYLTTALTHKSVTGQPNYERLEFLGDSVLGLVVAMHVYDSNPVIGEGGLTHLKNDRVANSTLAKIAHEFGLVPLIHYNRASIKKGIQDKEKIAADVFEAVIGAVFKDGSFKDAQQVIYRMGLIPELVAEKQNTIGVGDITHRLHTQNEESAKEPYADELHEESILQSNKHPKNLLQELTQKKFKVNPIYEVVKKPARPHEGEWQVECRISGRKQTTVGQGKTIKLATTNAARQMLQNI